MVNRTSIVTGTLLVGILAAFALAQPKPLPPATNPKAPPPPTTNQPPATRPETPTVIPQLLKSAKTSCTNDEFVALELCTNTGACTTAQLSCFPYRCQAKINGCKVGCSTDKDCSAGFACASGKCVMPRNFCDKNISKNLFGGARDCAPYLCDGATGQCRAQTCTNIDDCSSPNVCDFKNKCVPASAAEKK